MIKTWDFRRNEKENGEGGSKLRYEVFQLYLSSFFLSCFYKAMRK